MAKINSYEDFKNILTYLYNKTPDKYASLYLYEKESNKKDVIYTKTDELSYNNKIKYNVITIEDGKVLIDDTNLYLLPLLKSAVTDSPNSETSVYDKGISAYIDIDLLIANICIAFGIKLDANFSSINERDYNNMRDIVIQFYDEDNRPPENNSVYYVQKTHDQTTNEDFYKSYVPAIIVYRIGKYLQQIGAYEDTEVNYTQLYKPFAKYNYETMSFSETINGLYNANVMDEKFITDLKYVLKKLINNYDLEIDNNNLVFCHLKGYSNHTGPSTLYPINGFTFTLRIFPNDCYFNGSRGYVNYYSSTAWNYNDTANRFLISYDNDNTYYEYVCRLTYNEDDTIANYSISRNVGEIKENSKYSLYTGMSTNVTSTLFNNIIMNKRIKKYNNYDGNLGELESDIKITPNKLPNEKFNDFISYGYNIYEKFNVNITENDLALFMVKNNYDESGAVTDDVFEPKYGSMIVIRNAKNFIIPLTVEDAGGTTYTNSAIYTCKTDNYPCVALEFSNLYKTLVLPFGNNNREILFKYVFDEEKDFELYTYLDGEITVDKNKYSEYTLDIRNLPYYEENKIAVIDNLGYSEEIKKLGMYKIDGASYPENLWNDINDMYTWNTDWSKNKETVGGIFYKNDVLTGTNYNHFIPIATTEIESQEEALNGNIDETNYSTIVVDIGIVEDLNDFSGGGGDLGPEIISKPSINIGNTPDLPPISSLPNPLMCGLVKQYVLADEVVRDMASEMIQPGFWTSVNLFLTNPIDAIIDFSCSYMVNESGGSVAPLVVNGFTYNKNGTNLEGYQLANNFGEKDLGELSIDKYFNDYNDIVNTNLSIYLPYCGIQNLGIDEFLNGKIKLKCRFDTLTGVIVYYIYSVRDNCTQLLYTFNGNFTQKIPLTASGNERLYSSVFGISSNIVSGDLINITENKISEPKKTGSLSGNIGIMGTQIPYLIIKRNTEYLPNKLEELIGNPSNNYTALNRCTGFQKVKNVHVEINCTDTEKNMIETLLLGGVIV